MPRRPPPPRQGAAEGRTAWHVLLARLLQQRAPASFRVLSEVPLGKQPPRLDLLLLRRDGARDDSDATVLRGLWGRLAHLGLLEYKSPAEHPRQGELAKLLAYGLFYLADHPDEATPRGQLVVAMVVAARSALLADEVDLLGGQWRLDTEGYHEVTGLALPTLVVELDRVSEVERDELLGVFGHGSVTSVAVLGWWQQQTGENRMALEQMAGYEELVTKFVTSLTTEQRVAGLAPEEVAKFVTSLTTEQRLAGLLPEQLAATLPAELTARGGQVREARRAVERVLERRGLAMSEAQRAQLAACDDLTTLERWLDQAITAASAEDALR